MFEKVKERALKITEALYRTTDLFSDAEPLKWSLRNSALEVLNSSPQELGRMENLIKGLFLKLELASSGTFISKMNFDVLKREYANLLSDILSYRNSYQALLDNITGVEDTKKLSDNVPDNVASVAIQKHEPVTSMYTKGDGGRRESILAALKEKGTVGASVGDLSGTFGGSISGKTLQRDLNSLVGAGIIKKDGEKRWRRYFI